MKTGIENLTPEQIEAAMITCVIDGHKDLSLIDHLSEVHGMTVAEYQAASWSACSNCLRLRRRPSPR